MNLPSRNPYHSLSIVQRDGLPHLTAVHFAVQASGRTIARICRILAKETVMEVKSLHGSVYGDTGSLTFSGETTLVVANSLRDRLSLATEMHIVQSLPMDDIGGVQFDGQPAYEPDALCGILEQFGTAMLHPCRMAGRLSVRPDYVVNGYPAYAVRCTVRGSTEVCSQFSKEVRRWANSVALPGYTICVMLEVKEGQNPDSNRLA